MKADIAAAESHIPTEEELDARYPDEGYDAVGRSWCIENSGQLSLLANAAAKAEALSKSQLQYGLDHIRRVAPNILSPLQDTAAGLYLLSYIAGPAGEGNAEQLRTIFLGSLIRIATGQ